MNPTEISDALEAIAAKPFDPETFGGDFAEATDNPRATVSKLRSGTINRSDVPGGMLHNLKFHFAPATPGEVEAAMAALRASRKTERHKPAILIATDGETVSAEHRRSGDAIHFPWTELGDHFGFLLPAAGKERYRPAEENPVDVKAAGKLSRLYDALMRSDPAWAAQERRHAMNQFMTRLVFCLFAEDVGVIGDRQFSASAFTYGGDKGEHGRDAIAAIFAAMARKAEDRAALPAWARALPYVNGGLFAGEIDAPAFDVIAWRYLRDLSDLDWGEINPDIFGSMIQSVEVGRILDLLGKHQGRDPETGFDLVRRRDGRMLCVADLVDDGPGRGGVKAALAREITGPDGRRDDEADRAKVDIIIALGMAKEGFDWVWCEHALTIGYRSSLTEIVQIIGRATRDAPGKPHAQFTNLVAEPGVETTVVADAVNDMLKAISGALLMEQVLAPNFRFYRREDGDIREPVSVDADGRVTIGIKGLMEPPTDRAKAICENDMQDLVAKAIQSIDRRTIAEDVAPEVATQMVLTDIIEKSYEGLSEPEIEAVRQDLAARMNLLHLARAEAEREEGGNGADGQEGGDRIDDPDAERAPPTTLLDMVRRLINVRDLDIDLIDSINPFREGFDVASKALDTPLLQQIQAHMVAQRISMTEDEARTLWPRIKRFRAQEGREPNPHSPDPLEKRLAEAHAWIRTEKARRMRAARAAE